jgi:PAS domain S-box-containing protein
MAFSVHPDGSPDFVNQRWRDYAGWSKEPATGGGDWQATIHRDDVEIHLKKWQEALTGGGPFENEARHRSASGKYRWFLVRAVPFRDKQGKMVKWYGTLTDIEDRKRAEEERETLQTDLAHVNRVSMMGELTASVAHEIRQPITAAVMNASACLRWLDRDLPRIDKARESANNIVEDGIRASEIIDRLRSLYRSCRQNVSRSR